MVALDKCTKENGCLQVVKVSHQLGRIDHGVIQGSQVGAEPTRVAALRREIRGATPGLLVYCQRSAKGRQFPMVPAK
jgi:hypothetical protein